MLKKQLKLSSVVQKLQKIFFGRSRLCVISSHLVASRLTGAIATVGSAVPATGAGVSTTGAPVITTGWSVYLCSVSVSVSVIRTRPLPVTDSVPSPFRSRFVPVLPFRLGPVWFRSSWFPCVRFRVPWQYPVAVWFRFVPFGSGPHFFTCHLYRSDPFGVVLRRSVFGSIIHVGGRHSSTYSVPPSVFIVRTNTSKNQRHSRYRGGEAVLLVLLAGGKPHATNTRLRLQGQSVVSGAGQEMSR